MNTCAPCTQTHWEIVWPRALICMDLHEMPYGDYLFMSYRYMQISNRPSSLPSFTLTEREYRVCFWTVRGLHQFKMSSVTTKTCNSKYTRTEKLFKWAMKTKDHIFTQRTSLLLFSHLKKKLSAVPDFIFAVIFEKYYNFAHKENHDFRQYSINNEEIYMFSFSLNWWRTSSEISILFTGLTLDNTNEG